MNEVKKKLTHDPERKNQNHWGMSGKKRNVNRKARKKLKNIRNKLRFYKNKIFHKKTQ